MNIEIPEGYKQTEIGIIPNDWNIRDLKTISKVVRGGSPRPAGNPKFFGGSYIPWLTVASLTNIAEFSLYVSQTVGCLTEEGSKYSRTLDNGTLIIANSGATLGVAKILAIRCCANDGIAALIDLDESIDKLFLCYFLNTKTREFREVIAPGNGQPNLNTTLIGLTKVPLPPTIGEQKAIAQALSDVDAAIAELDRLITKKRNIRQGATQQLLTGKKRLSGFGQRKGYKQTEIGIIPEDWNVHKISDLVDNNRIPSGIYKEKGLYGKGTKIIKIGDVFSFDYFNPANAQRVFLNKNELLIYRVCVNDIFIALASVKLEGVGKVMLVTHLDENTAYDHNIALIRANNLVEPRFLFYLLKSNLIRKQVAKLSTQVGTTFLKSSTILAFHLAIPALKAEQTSIAAVLSDIDIEIEALEQKRDKYKAIKQAMMQELLTGRTRLI